MMASGTTERLDRPKMDCSARLIWQLIGPMRRLNAEGQVQMSIALSSKAAVVRLLELKSMINATVSK